MTFGPAAACPAGIPIWDRILPLDGSAAIIGGAFHPHVMRVQSMTSSVRIPAHRRRRMQLWAAHGEVENEISLSGESFSVLGRASAELGLACEIPLPKGGHAVSAQGFNLPRSFGFCARSSFQNSGLQHCVRINCGCDSPIEDLLSPAVKRFGIPRGSTFSATPDREP
jgi:hypothetical protein